MGDSFCKKMPVNQEILLSQAEEILNSVRVIKRGLQKKTRQNIDDDDVLMKLDELLSEENIQILLQPHHSDIRHLIIDELMTCCGRLTYPHAKSLCSDMLLLAWGDEKGIKEIKLFRDELMLRRGRLLELIIPETSRIYALEARLKNIKLPRFLRNTFLSRINISSNPNTLDLVTTLSYLSFVVIIVIISSYYNHRNDPPDLKDQDIIGREIQVRDPLNGTTKYYDKSSYDSLMKSQDSTSEQYKSLNTPKLNMDSFLSKEAESLYKEHLDAIYKAKHIQNNP